MADLGDIEDDARAVCLLAAGASLNFGIGIDRSVPMAEEALASARRAGRADAARSACSILAAAHLVAGDFEAGEAYVALVPTEPLTYSTITALSVLEYSYWTRGRFAEARVILDGITNDFNPRLDASLALMRMQLDLANGSDSGAVGRLVALIDHANRRGFTSAIAQLGWGPGVWRMLHGEPEAGAEAVVAWLESTQQAWTTFVLWAFLTLGRLDETREVLETERGRFWGAEAGAIRATVDVVLTRAEGDLANAEQRGHDALVAQHHDGFRPQLVHTLEALAGLAAAQGSSVECARLAGAAQALRDEMGYVLRWPYETELREADFAAARAAMGDDEFDAAFAEGRTLDEEAAVAYAQRARGERKRPTAGWESLTPTELNVVRLVAAGLTNKDVGRELLMGAETVKTHLSHVYDKLGIRSRAALATEFAARPTTNRRD
jgi:DNA-binding CsgD family transcriptional regulator